MNITEVEKKEKTIQNISFVKCCFTCDNCQRSINIEYYDPRKSTDVLCLCDIETCYCRLHKCNVEPFTNMCNNYNG